MPGGNKNTIKVTLYPKPEHANRMQLSKHCVKLIQVKKNKKIKRNVYKSGLAFQYNRGDNV